MNKNLLTALVASVILLGNATDAISCTSIMVGKKASSDGSVMTAHACDSYYRTYVTIEPRRNFAPGEMESIYFNLLHKEEPWDPRRVKETGKIVPPKSQTYRFVNTAYPCLNEKQLAIGETTFDGRRELLNRNGIFWIEELERIALEYCDNARDAIRLMGALAEEYGYADWGEALTVADKNEVWLFEINGPGPGKPGAIWAAQRVPADHICVSANISRIAAIDFSDKENFMYCKDLKKKARELGYWDGKGPLKFYEVVGGDKPFGIREYFIYKTLAPSLDISMDDAELPFSIKPEKPVTPEQMFALYRQTYEGTEYDMTKNLRIKVHRKIKDLDSKPYPEADYFEYDEVISPVSNFMSAEMRQMLNTIAPGSVDRTRTIAVIQCAYSWIAQLRDWLPDQVGGVCWFAYDNEAQSPRFPIYAGQTTLPEPMSHCGQERYREDAAVWAFRETNRVATISWDRSRKILEPAQAVFEQKMLEQDATLCKTVSELVSKGEVEKAEDAVNQQCDSFFTMVAGKWRELKGRVLELFIRSM